MRLSLGAVSVTAPRGAIARGQMLTLSIGGSTGFGAEAGSSIAGGPYVLSTSQGQPKTPVTVTIGYNAALLGSGAQPLLLHGWSMVHRWLPEPATVNTTKHAVTAKLASFSPLDIIDDTTYWAGIVTGNRADLPAGCGAAPRWLDSVTLPDSNTDPLPTCFSSTSNEAEAVLNMVNNRGYAQVVAINGAKADVTKSRFSDTLEGEVAKLFADLGSRGGSSTFILGPGDSATVTIDRPASQQAAQEVHIDQAPQVVSGAGEMAWAVLSTASDTVSVPVDRVNCIMASVFNASSFGGPSSAIDQMHSCINAAASGTVRDVLQKLAYGLLVDDFFYKIIDLEGDKLYPPEMGFTIPGTNPTFTSPDIHISPLNLGTLSDGKTTIVPLAASGGAPPYRFYIWNEPGNAAKVPSWVHLASDGTLTIEPPVSASGEVSFAVYAFDANGEHSPFAREVIRFQTFSGEEGPGAGPAEPAVGVSAGYETTCAVLATGKAKCWGAGALGNGEASPATLFPVSVTGITNATQISTGFSYACALLTTGEARCWGANSQGLLGDGTNAGPEICGVEPSESPCSTVPVAVTGVTDAAGISAGELRTCILTVAGAMECWGKLGATETPSAESLTPAPVGGISHASAITHSQANLCELSAGTVYCWGWNENGGLGNGSDIGPEECEASQDFSCSLAPVKVNGISSAVAISTNNEHTCAVLSGGEVECWGTNERGELGQGTDTGPEECGSGIYANPCSVKPLKVPGITDATAVSAGTNYTCALLGGGTIKCWGYDGAGQLGDGNVTGTTPPVTVSGITDAVAVSAGTEHTCAVLADGGIDCWGGNWSGQLGNGTTTLSDVPVPVSGIE